MGIDSTFESENGDFRALSGDISLPGHQADLVARVAAAAKHPITVMATGSSVDLSPLKSNPSVGAILWRGYGGEAAGQATADVLFGMLHRGVNDTHTHTHRFNSFLRKRASGTE